MSESKPTGVTEEGISLVLSGLISHQQNEQVAAAVQALADPEAVNALQAIREGDFDSLYFGYQRPFAEVVSGMCQTAWPGKSQLHFLLEEAQFVDRHLSHIFVKYEGSACSADKASFLMTKLFDFHAHGKPIVFDLAQKYTYHIPKKVLCTQDSAVDYLRALWDLFYGSPARYVDMLAVIESQAASSQ